MSDVHTYIPEVAHLAGDTADPVKQLERAARGRSVRLALIGGAGCGKSTLLNALVSVLRGSYCHVQDCGSVWLGDKREQRTMAPSLIPIVDFALDAATNAVHGFETFVWDLPCFRSAQELAVMLSGRLRSGERFPKVNDLTGLDNVLQRRVTPKDAVNCGIVLVPANDIQSHLDSKDPIVQRVCAPPAYVTDAITVARSYTANTSDEHVLPLILVITKLEEWEGAQGHDCSVLQERKGCIAPLLQQVAKWGFQSNMVVTTGFLDSSSVDYANPQDPCVLALKHLLSLAVKTGSLYQQGL